MQRYAPPHNSLLWASFNKTRIPLPIWPLVQPEMQSKRAWAVVYLDRKRIQCCRRDCVLRMRVRFQTDLIFIWFFPFILFSIANSDQCPIVDTISFFFLIMIDRSFLKGRTRQTGTIMETESFRSDPIGSDDSSAIAAKVPSRTESRAYGHAWKVSWASVCFSSNLSFPIVPSPSIPRTFRRRRRVD